MHVSTHSGRHAGGTRAPFRRERGGPPSGIQLWRAIDVVPGRATEGLSDGEKSPEIRGSRGVEECSGMLWHGGPRESARGHRRSR